MLSIWGERVHLISNLQVRCATRRRQPVALPKLLPWMLMVYKHRDSGITGTPTPKLAPYLQTGFRIFKNSERCAYRRHPCPHNCAQIVPNGTKPTVTERRRM